MVYAVVSTFGGGHVFRSTNGGTSWTNISGNLPNLPTWSLQIDPSGALYVGNDTGVYVSTNTGTSWSPLGTGLPNAQVFQIALNTNYHTLAAGTHGRGMWEILTNQAPSLSINDVTVTEGNAGQRAPSSPSPLSTPSSFPVTVDFATADGTAVAPGDYLASHRHR